MYTTIRVACALALLFVAPAHAAPAHAADITGHWAIDLAPMLAQAERLDTPEPALRAMRRKAGTRLEIGADSIKYTVEGEALEPITFRYRVAKIRKNCVFIVVNGLNETARYCVDGERLSIHHARTRAIVSYRRP